MGLEYEFHKWPFEQQKQILSQITQCIPIAHSKGLAMHVAESSRAGGCSPRVRVPFRVQSAQLLRAAAGLEFSLRGRLTITFKKGPKGKMKDPSQTNQQQALTLPRGTERHAAPGMLAPAGATREVSLSFPVQCAINYSCINIQIPYRI